MKGKALLAGCIALVMSSAALAEDIKIAVVGAIYRRRAGGSGYQR